MRSDVEFEGIPSTLFLVLAAQYLESKSPHGIIKDQKVIEIVDSLGLDLSKYPLTVNDRLGVGIRKEIITRELQKFVNQNPDGIVINLGCGLDTYHETFKDTKILWYDLDLPHVIELRRQFFSETQFYKFISKSVMDFSWMQEIPKHNKTFVLIEGFLPYFLENEVKALLTSINNQFAEVELLLHALSPWRTLLIHKNLKKASLKLGWGITNGKSMEHWLQNLYLRNEWYPFTLYPSRWSRYVKLLNLFPFMRQQEKILHFTRDCP